MRVKLKYALPLVQMGLAAVLAWCHHLWLLAIMSSGSDSPGSSPSLRLLHSLNWPVLLVPKYRSMPFPLDAVAVAAVAGLLWYWVALNLDEFSQRRRVVMFERVPLRIGGDLLMIVSGACF